MIIEMLIGDIRKNTHVKINAGKSVLRDTMRCYFEDRIGTSFMFRSR